MVGLNYRTEVKASAKKVKEENAELRRDISFNLSFSPTFRAGLDARGEFNHFNGFHHDVAQSSGGEQKPLKWLRSISAARHPNLKVGENEKLRIPGVYDAEGLLV